MHETDGEPALIAVHWPGRFLGDVSLLTNLTIYSTAVAQQEDVEVLAIPVGRLKEAVSEDPGLGTSSYERACSAGPCSAQVADGQAAVFLAKVCARRLGRAARPAGLVHEVSELVGSATLAGSAASIR